MKIIDMTCPHCGANLKIDSEKTVAYCEHCGAKLAIDDETRHIQYDNAEQAGYEFEKGRQRAQAEARLAQPKQFTYNAQNKPPQKEKKNTWLWVLGWIFFFPAPVMVLIWRKKNTWDIKVKIAVTVAFWLFFLIAAANNDKEQTTASSEQSKQEASASKEASTPSETEIDSKEPLDNFFKAYIEKGRVETIEDLAKDCGVYMNKKNTGTSAYYKVALTKNDAKAVSLSDLTKGDYCIVIDGKGESLTYYNNVDMIEIDYSDDNGYSLYDKSRLMPYDDGTMRLVVNSAEEALAYKPTLDDKISPIEQFYCEARIGMSGDELQVLLDKYGLEKHFRRSNSDDGYISYGGVENYDYGTCIGFVLRETLTDLDFYDYYVKQKYGLHVEYIMDSQASKRSGDYAEPGYYIVGDDTVEYFGSADEAIKSLHSYRTK
nr:zinc ribbon domain-containing protein [uncultured Butyrivibrio sp.]